MDSRHVFRASTFLVPASEEKGKKAIFNQEIHSTFLQSNPPLLHPSLPISVKAGGGVELNKNIMFCSKWHCMHFNCSEISAVHSHP